MQTVRFNHNDDHINGIFELPEDGEFSDCLEENQPFDISMVQEPEDLIPVPGVPKPASSLELPFETKEEREKGFADYKAKMADIERFEAEGIEWVVDHTGIRRKPFKVMHREIKDIL